MTKRNSLLKATLVASIFVSILGLSTTAQQAASDGGGGGLGSGSVTAGGGGLGSGSFVAGGGVIGSGNVIIYDPALDLLALVASTVIN